MKLDKRRRQENKTNYKKRLILLKGKSPRLVIRKTNQFITLHIVESHDAHDKVIHSVSTSELLKNGWPKENKGSLKSIPAAYLGGLLLGKKAKELKTKVILDTGLIPSTKGSRIYAALKGVADSGLKVNYDEKMIPAKEKLEGKNSKAANVITKVKEKIK